ncbi:sensor domain-containing diguanylate cyclase [Candidatus Thiodiazotropha endoloripes]|uniref:diguanylate cyclase n=1 Tax=Candidatus Thiodiazotropha endoloripes TaxID=1818881 RepID=A0A1E2UL01_9GAMM|nr:sensor domain-containing diguanylate cyclase [Candidatus Thiodiazotropha endoloripes]MCG7903976.1 diguanylate cyclase [Candidatus Thiodiazotropha weberae]ODB90664.1 diguanylate cyclase [Candidatus Thiodiazotropha endoloripes]ODB94041.1 diguanylate cyclase [Candidatus Thiodiazotropha endoloripes]ODB95430.1 diguanylate cyclase [Candidatus Thiodiazotropha endoloripes]
MFDTFDFLNLVLDTITDHIAVIDDQGTIIYVNKSWIDFGLSNGIPENTEWVGVNYFDACAPRDGAEELSVKSDIEDVINGKTRSFYHEYPCHSPTEKRWFQMRVNALEFDKSRIVIIDHSNITERKIAEEQALYLSRIDSLTGLSNRRHFDDFLTDEWKRCIRSQMPITMAMIDIDFFKHLNDSSGHHAGDECLETISDIMKEFAKRPSDVCARYGGDEFVIVYGNSAMDESLVLMLKLMDTIRKKEIPNPDSPISSNITVSIGLATAYPDIDSTEEDIIKAADTLLYKAKDGGRDHIEFATI